MHLKLPIISPGTFDSLSVRPYVTMMFSLKHDPLCAAVLLWWSDSLVCPCIQTGLWSSKQECSSQIKSGKMKALVVPRKQTCIWFPSRIWCVSSEATVWVCPVYFPGYWSSFLNSTISWKSKFALTSEFVLFLHVGVLSRVKSWLNTSLPRSLFFRESGDVAAIRG